MSLLVINAALQERDAVEHAIQTMAQRSSKVRVIDSTVLDIRPCKGCCGCMLKTPGECCQKDDYEEVLKAYLEYDHIVFIADTALGFINHAAKNIIDRIFPLVHVLTHFRDGEVLHIPRYKRNFKLALLYTGEAEQGLLEEWMSRFEKNMGGQAIGVFPIDNMEDLCQCIS